MAMIDDIQLESHVIHKVIAEVVRNELDKELSVLREEQIKRLDDRINSLYKKLTANTKIHVDKTPAGEFTFSISMVVDPQSLIRESGFTT